MLHSMFSHRWKHELDEDGCVFVDHPPEVMLPLINWLRIMRDTPPGGQLPPVEVPPAFRHQWILMMLSYSFRFKHLRMAGISEQELLEKGVDITSLLQEFEPKQLKDAGVNADLLVVRGLTAQDLLNRGHDVQELLTLGFRASHLKNVRLSAQQLQDVGFSVGDLKKQGFHAGYLKDIGIDARQLKDIGFSKWDLEDAGFELQDLSRLFAPGQRAG